VNLRDEDYLRHILDAISAIESYVTEGEAAFRADRKTRDAVIRNLEVVGEAASKLSEDLRDKNADVPWTKIVGMRNRLIHGYLTVDQDVLWSTVADVLPDFKQRIERLLGQAGEDGADLPTSTSG
jgi:uncharacterized protein with HEPN domain